MRPLDLVKLILSYPAICFWLSVFCFATALLSSAFTVLLNGRSLTVATVSQLHSFTMCRPFLRVGSLVSAAAMGLAGLATHNYAKRLLRPPGRTVLLDAAMIANVVSLACIGFLGHFLLTLFYLVSGLIWHAIVDTIPRRPVPLGRGMNQIIGASAAVACGRLALGRLAGSRLLTSIAAAGEIVAVLVLHLRFIPDGATVLGARFLPDEVRPAILNPNRFEL
jgi:hypothetical protein